MERALVLWALQSMVRAFNQWAAFYFQTKEMKEKGAVIMKRWLSGVLAGAFHGWLDAVLNHQDQMAKVKACVLKILHAKAHSALATWKEYAKTSSHLKHTAMKVVARIRNRELHSSFGTWQKRTADAQEEKNCMRRALGFFTNRSLASAFTRWVDFIQEIYDLREKLTKAVIVFAMRAQAASFRGWAHTVETTKGTEGSRESDEP